MTTMKFKGCFPILSLIYLINVVDSYNVRIQNDGPVVQGANITFVAQLFDTFDTDRPTGTFLFKWVDNAIPQHTGQYEGSATVSMWIVSYPAHTYPSGTYEVQVIVYNKPFYFWSIASERQRFNVTAMLTGKLLLSQNNSVVTNGFISNALQVTHNIKLHQADLDYLTAKATSVSTYWFVDCIYLGQTSDYTFTNNYTTVDKVHNVEALIVASYEPITTPAPITTTTTAATTTTTTTTATTPTTTTTTTTTKPTTTTVKPTTTETPHNKSGGQPYVLMPNRLEMALPFVCLNSSIIPPDPNKTYGYFHESMEVKAPISNIRVDGTNWLQQKKDVLNLQVSWEGSPYFTYCIKYSAGPYNVTGKEKCQRGDNHTHESDNSTFHIQHYFTVLGNYTILFIVSNNVSHIVYPVTINIYEVTQQAQLSVIVVPVVCSFLAVILIVFGVAYYMQSRTRFIVEVADFNFGQAENMEYKTFGERLRDSIQGGGYSCPDFTKPGENNWQPGGSRNEYGRMNN